MAVRDAHHPGIDWPARRERFGPPVILGSSIKAVALRAVVSQVARVDVSVLVTGASGSGKEVVARSIHAASARHGGPFVALNCAAIPRDLIESELFGHARGAFTGAIEARIGRVEEAHGGTLFLDEIGDMPADMQAKLLRVIEERRVDRLGGGASRAVDVRIIAATHRDLGSAIAQGLFREDLYFRLNVFPIRLPSLAERADDIPELAAHFALQLAGGGQPVGFSPGALAVMARAAWRGNARELRNFVERTTVVVEPGAVLDAAGAVALLDQSCGAAIAADAPGAPATPAWEEGHCDLDAVLGGLEQLYIAAALDRAQGVVAEAARLLGLRRTTLLDRMRKHNISSMRSQSGNARDGAGFNRPRAIAA